VEAFPLRIYFQKHIWFFGLVGGKNQWMGEEGTWDEYYTDITVWMKIIHRWIGEEGTWMNITRSISGWMKIIHKWID